LVVHCGAVNLRATAGARRAGLHLCAGIRVVALDTIIARGGLTAAVGCCAAIRVAIIVHGAAIDRRACLACVSRRIAGFRTIAGHPVVTVDVHLTGELAAGIAAVAIRGVAVVTFFGAIRV